MLKPTDSRQIYILLNEERKNPKRKSKEEPRNLLQTGIILRIYSPALTSAFKFIINLDKKKYPGKLYIALEYEEEK